MIKFLEVSILAKKIYIKIFFTLQSSKMSLLWQNKSVTKAIIEDDWKLGDFKNDQVYIQFYDAGFLLNG